MDAIDTLQSSTPETKAERIARYKAERRRELAERYGNTEEFTPKYVRRDRKIGETSETESSGTKEREKREDNGSEPTYSRRGMRTKVADSGDEATHESDANSDLKTETESEVVSSIEASSSFRLLETDDPEEPKAEKASDSAGKMSYFKEEEGEVDGSSTQRCDDSIKHQLISSDREGTSTSLSNADKEKAMEESTQESSWKEQQENTVTTEQKQPFSFLSDRASPPSKNRDASPPPSPLSQSAPSLQRQDSGPQGIRGILKKSRSTSVESDHSEGMSTGMPSRQTSVTLSHPESEEEEDDEVEEEEYVEEEVSRESDKEDDSPADDIPDGGSFSVHREEKNSGGSTSSRESFEEMRSPSPDESLETTSTVSEDVDELESSFDQSQGSALKHRLAVSSGEDGENKDRTRKSKPPQVIQTSLTDRFNQLHDAENAWKKKFLLPFVAPVYIYRLCSFL